MTRLLSMLLSLLLITQLGCFGGGAPADQLANANYEIAGFIGDAQQNILDALKLRVIAPDKALAAGEAVQRANLTQQKLLRELVKRLQTNGDKEELVLTEGDKSFLVGLTTLISDTAGEIVNDPAILKLDSATRAAVVTAIMALKPIATRLATLIQKAPVEKKVAPSLRQQLDEATRKAEHARRDNDRLFAELTMEVAR